MGAIQNDWLQAVGGEFRKPYYKELYDFVKEEYSTRVIYPPADDIFNALHLTPLKEVKVVILGQDPYHNEHQAHGLSFSVLPDQREIPRLCRIFIRNSMMIWAVTYRIMDIWKNGQGRAC